MENKKNIRTLVGVSTLFSIISFFIHGYLAIHHYQVKYGLTSGDSFCNINEKFNCDLVTLSKFSELLGYPIALFGATTHLVFIVLSVIWFINLASNRSFILRIMTYLGIFVFSMSLIMGIISVTLLSTYCILCISTYIASLFIFIPLLALKNESEFPKILPDLKTLFLEQKWILGTFLSIPLLTLFLNSVILDNYGLNEIDSMISESVNIWKSQPEKTFNSALGLSLKETTAKSYKYTIVEFADFLCPHCQAAAKPIHQYAETHPEVNLIFKSFPLDGSCNELIPQKGDGLRCKLSAVVFCSEKLNHSGWKLYDYIFENQSVWSNSTFDNDLINLSEKFKLDQQALKECINSSEIHQFINSQAKEGDGIQGTPTIFVNGRILPKGQFYPVLDRVGKELGL